MANTSGYKPKAAKETRKAVKLLIPTAASYHGVQKPSYPTTGETVFVSWYGKRHQRRTQRHRHGAGNHALPP